MNVKTFIIQAEETAIDALKAAGTVLEQFVLGESQKLVAEVKQTDIGTRALNLISGLQSSTLSGADKLNLVVAAVVPLITKLSASGGLSSAIHSVEDFALEFAQSVYNDFKANVLGKIG